MKAFITTYKGMETISELEISELIKSKGKIEEYLVKFDIKKYEELAKLTYLSQSIKKSVLLLSEFEVDEKLDKTFNNFKKNLNFDIKDWKFDSFKIHSERLGQHEFNSVDIAQSLTKEIIKIYNDKKIEIIPDYNNPKLIFYVFVNNSKGYFGIDFSGFELSKRQYKIFTHPESLKGITGYYLVRHSGYKKKDIMIDPFMGSGIVPIEAALYYSKYPVHYYDKDKLAFTKYHFFKDKFFEQFDKKFDDSKSKIYGYDAQLRYLKATQKNFKLSGVNSTTTLSKIDVEWLDTKFEKKSVDLIITDPPRTGKHRDIIRLKKVYNELFYQAAFVLKKTGKMILLAKSKDLLLEYAKTHKFKLDKENIIYQGQDQFYVLTFIRGN
jgi:23S rRNA G2445 N2-methylase RlmL